MNWVIVCHGPRLAQGWGGRMRWGDGWCSGGHRLRLIHLYVRAVQTAGWHCSQCSHLSALTQRLMVKQQTPWLQLCLYSRCRKTSTKSSWTSSLSLKLQSDSVTWKRNVRVGRMWTWWYILVLYKLLVGITNMELWTSSSLRQRRWMWPRKCLIQLELHECGHLLVTLPPSPSTSRTRLTPK